MRGACLVEISSPARVWYAPSLITSWGRCCVLIIPCGGLSYAYGRNVLTPSPLAKPILDNTLDFEHLGVLAQIRILRKNAEYLLFHPFLRSSKSTVILLTISNLA